MANYKNWTYNMTFSSDPIVRVKEASIFQENNTILTDVNFDVSKGELVFLVGRTGSGKSSLLKTLYADLTLRLGEVHMAGYDIKSIKRNEETRHHLPGFSACP